MMPEPSPADSATACSIAVDADMTVDAEAIAPLLHLSPEQFMNNLRRGVITQLTERGVDEHAGLFRVTFRYRNRCCRIVLNQQTGKIDLA